MTKELIKIDFEPIGKRIEAQKGTTLLEAAHNAGIDLVAVCGGAGSCGKCQVQLITDKLPPPNAVEQSFFTIDLLEKGWRLACQTEITQSIKVHIPSDSLTTPQRLQMEGESDEQELHSSFEIEDIELSKKETNIFLEGVR